MLTHLRYWIIFESVKAINTFCSEVSGGRSPDPCRWAKSMVIMVNIENIISWTPETKWSVKFHDDVIKWKHFPRYWPFVRVIHRSPVNSPHKGQWPGALMFSMICVWINGWVNNGWWFETLPRPLWRHSNIHHFVQTTICHGTGSDISVTTDLTIYLCTSSLQSILCNSFEVQTPVDFVYRWPSFKWIAAT